MAKNYIEFENAEIIYRNFEGREDKFNRAGNRHFSVILSEEQAIALSDMGCNVKRTKPRDPEEEGRPYVKILLGIYDPEIYVITRGKKKLLQPNQYGKLDRLEIEQADFEVSRSNKEWESNGKTGHSLYLETLVVKIRESRILSKYEDYDDDDVEELPFN